MGADQQMTKEAAAAACWSAPAAQREGGGGVEWASGRDAGPAGQDAP